MPSVDHRLNIVEVHDVSYAYNGRDALRHVSLNIHKGDYLGIIGPNGSGKTTLLKLIVGLLEPSLGTVKLFGQDVREFRDWTKIGYVPQKATYFDPNFPVTVREVVQMGRYAKLGLFRLLSSRDQQIVTESLEKVGMTRFIKTLIGDLSGGQQQRVLIARALASSPEILLLDEPTVGVDTATQEQFYDLLGKLNKEFGLTLVLVSHDVDVVSHETTEIACLNNTLAYHGTPKDFIKGDYLAKVYGKRVKFIVHAH